MTSHLRSDCFLPRLASLQNTHVQQVPITTKHSLPHTLYMVH